jgi:hypothetical protein
MTPRSVEKLDAESGRLNGEPELEVKNGTSEHLEEESLETVQDEDEATKVA